VKKDVNYNNVGKNRLAKTILSHPKDFFVKLALVAVLIPAERGCQHVKLNVSIEKNNLVKRLR